MRKECNDCILVFQNWTEPLMLANNYKNQTCFLMTRVIDRDLTWYISTYMYIIYNNLIIRNILKPLYFLYQHNNVPSILAVPNILTDFKNASSIILRFLRYVLKYRSFTFGLRTLIFFITR